MPPIVPEDLTSLSAAELRDLAEAIRLYAIGVFSDSESSAEDRAAARALTAQRPTIAAEIARQDDLATDEALRTALEAEEPAPAPAPEPEVVPAAEVEVVPTASVQTTIGVPSEPAPTGGNLLAQFQAAAGVDGKRAGDSFESWADLSASIGSLASAVDPGSEKRFEVARVVANYPTERIITSEEQLFGLSRMDPQEITAAYCPPATPYYALACQNTMRRPVFNSMSQFQAPRGRVQIPSSPTLQDLQGQGAGYGRWTAAMDDDTNAVKTCATVSCNSWTTYEMYAVWRCLTVKNLMFMTYPELVEHYLMLLGAAWARLAETLLLDAMATGTSLIYADALGYGATTTLTRTLLTYLALYVEQQRWDLEGDGFEFWAHRYILTGVKLDLISRRRHDGSTPTIPSDEEVNAIFRSAGFEPHWFIDTPTWGIPVSSVATGGNMNRLPVRAQFLVAPKGKFAVIDRGQLSIGVNGNNLYRDNTSNSKNQFTMFFENFEGVVNTTSCPAHLIDIPLCWNGVQVDDQLVNCAGQNMPGYQS